MRNTRSGFTLVELSIVMIILGLLAGGILSAKHLIRASELRSVPVSIEHYRTAIYGFKNKYFMLPGDMNNATQFWGVRASSGGDVTCHQTVGSYTGTCNGDGDGAINYIVGDSTTTGERFAAWQHMARSGLIEGNYTGASGSNVSIVRTVNVNVPPSKANRGIFELGWINGPLSGDTSYFDGGYNFHVIRLLSSSTSEFPLKPTEAWNLDKKFDDGQPGLGVMFVMKNTAPSQPNCATTDVVTTSQYNTSSDSFLCNINVRNAAIKDMRLFHARIQRVHACFHFRDHAASNGAIRQQPVDLLRVDGADEFLVLGENARHVRQHHQLRCLKRRRNCACRRVGIDIIGLAIRAHANRCNDRNHTARHDVANRFRVDLRRLTHEAKVEHFLDIAVRVFLRAA
jgi:prepilin-type N-terminal cleavage/methylation domain-containing protein